MEVKGLKITGWKKAVSESGNYGGRLFNNVYCNFKTGEVWLKEETQNSWTVYQNPDVMQVLSSPYKLTGKQIEAAIADKMDILVWAELLEEASEEYNEDFAQEKALEKFEQIAWTTETADSPELLEVAQELADELNAYIEEEEDC